MTLTREQIEAFRAFLMREYVEPGPRWAKDEAYVHALCNAALRSMSVPAEGWVAVPLEPTEEMLDMFRMSWGRTYRQSYAALLALAPKP